MRSGLPLSRAISEAHMSEAHASEVEPGRPHAGLPSARQRGANVKDMMGLSPALQFVIECARRSCGASERALPADPDWEDVLRHADAQSLFAAVASVTETVADDVPGAESRREIQVRATVAHMQRRLRQEPGIQHVLSLLREAGCSPVVLKGAAVAYSRYVRPEFRSFADLDLLLLPDELGRANLALLAAGFDDSAAFPMPDGHHHLPPLFAPHREIVVELHSTVFEARCPFAISITEWIARAEPTTILGQSVRMLSATDALLHTCAHLSYGHSYLRYPLRSLTDILALTQHGDVEWSALVRRAHLAQMNGAVVWPLAVARAWLGAPIPTSVIQQLLPAQPLRWLIGTAMGSGYILDRGATTNDGTAVAYERLLELSILGRSSLLESGKVLFNGLFPPANTLLYCPSAASTSSTRHTLNLMRPTRIWRGLRAISRLIAQRNDWTTSEAFTE
jgi:hypothetical protein